MKTKLLRKLRKEARERYQLKYLDDKYHMMFKSAYSYPYVSLCVYYCEGLAIEDLLETRKEYILDIIKKLKKERYDKFKKKQGKSIENEVNKRLRKI